MLLDNVVVRPLRNAPVVMSVVATLIAGPSLGLFSQVINSHSINGAAAGPGAHRPAQLQHRRAVGHAVVRRDPDHRADRGGRCGAVPGSSADLGRGIRSAADNADAARMAGIPVNVMSSIAWALAGGLAALTAILTEPAAGLSSGDSFGPSLLLIALTGAVLARMRSLPGAMVGGLAIGVIEQLLAWNSSNSGLSEMALFVLIVVALLIQRQPVGRGEDKRLVVWSSRPVLPAPRPGPRAVVRQASLERGFRGSC